MEAMNLKRYNAITDYIQLCFVRSIQTSRSRANILHFFAYCFIFDRHAIFLRDVFAPFSINVATEITFGLL